jgi:hypothetical protein
MNNRRDLSSKGEGQQNMHTIYSRYPAGNLWLVAESSGVFQEIPSRNHF